VIENLRGRSTETKYGRIPLWLYETGVGLQAIATYGWLHGRYGHYERVMPSYGTLARELGVSRGSVIAYVKALTSVGAVRIETSGATGQQTNLYAIAFNEPFEVVQEQVRGGQNADHPVSGLYRSGQPADPGGQRAVHEEDVLKKTKTLPPPPSPAPARPQELPVTDREGGREEAALAPQEQAAADALTRIVAAVPQLPLGASEITRLAPLAVPWLERTTEARLAQALTAGLPATVGSPARIVQHRLLEKLPAAVMPAGARGRDMCPDHPFLYRHNCVECAMAAPA